MARFQSATEQKERSREVTKAVVARELTSAGVIARMALKLEELERQLNLKKQGWSAYLTEPMKKQQNPTFLALLCIESPAGLLVWRLSLEELDAFKDWLPYRTNDGRTAEDKVAAMYALAFDGWE